MNRFTHPLSVSAIALLAIGGAAPRASAQETAGSPVVEEVLVYAQKRAAGESLQKVPIAITAVDERMLERTFSRDIEDVGRMAPSVQLQPVGTFVGYTNLTIRGIGAAASSVRTVDPSINIFQDGMVIAYQAGAMLGTNFDLESVEILRGPQGVLFGKNASGGAVVLRTRRPTEAFHTQAEVTVGNAEELSASGSVEGALGSDRVLGKLAVIQRHNGGLFKATNAGTYVATPANPSGQPPAHSATDEPKINEITIKPTFVLKPNDDLSITLLTQYQKFNDGGGASRAFLPPNPRTFPAATVFGYTPPKDSYELDMDQPGYTHLEEEHFIGQADWNLGPGTWTTIAAFRHLIYNSTLDVDGTPFALVTFPDNRERNHQFSLESRYAADIGDRFNFVIGGYYFNDSSTVLEKRIQAAITAANPYNVVDVQTNWTQKEDVYAVFGSADYKIIDKLTLSAGGRYTHEKKSISIAPLTNCTGPNFTGCNNTFIPNERTWNNFSPRLALTYNWTDSALLYASWTKGFRSGNYNGRATNALTVGPTNPETVNSYEIGTKTTMAGGRLRMNLAGYVEDYTDIQRTVQGGVNGVIVTSLFNAASANLKGVELESTWRPVDSLELQGSVGWIDAHFNSFTGLPATVNVATLKFDHVPDWTAFIAGTYSFGVGGLDGEFSLRLSYSWQSMTYTDVNNTPDLSQDAYGLLDASLNYEQGPWRASLFAHNVANVHFVDIKSTAFNYQAYGGQPRVYGLRLAVKY